MTHDTDPSYGDNVNRTQQMAMELFGEELVAGAMCGDCNASPSSHSDFAQAAMCGDCNASTEKITCHRLIQFLTVLFRDHKM